jgi:NADH-ubiquinone oxidoreductase chain 2
VVGLAQVRVKRLLAYSTVSHVGFLLLALSIGGQDSTAAYLFYVVQYTLTSLLAFLIVLGLGYYTSENTNTTQTTYDLSAIDELQGSFLRSPALAACLAVTLFSMAGVPPLVGFFAKQAVLTTAVKAGYLFVSIVGVVTSVISASYYLYLIRVSHINQMTTGGHYKINFIGGRENVTVINGEINTQSRITATHSYVVAVLTLSLIGFIATPQIVLDTCRLMALTQYNI